MIQGFITEIRKVIKMKLVKILTTVKLMIGVLKDGLKDEASIEGNKETKEGLVGLNELTLFFAQRFADGVDLGDLKALWDKWSDDSDFQEKMKVAAKDIGRAKAEIKDLDAGEGLEAFKSKDESEGETESA